MLNLYREYLAQEAQDEALMKAWEAEEAEEALEGALLEEVEAAWEAGNLDLYSDLYKDLYGVRPRLW